jgi:hypothetical protein
MRAIPARAILAGHDEGDGDDKKRRLSAVERPGGGYRWRRADESVAVADRAGIELTAGRRTMGRPLSPEKRVKVDAGATQLELARQCGVSRSTVGRAMRARRALLDLAE